MEAKMVTSDTVRWYNVGRFGEAGYAVPAWGNDIATLNPNVSELTDLIGQNLFALLHQEDADMQTPPSVNTLRAVHSLYVRAGQILTARAVPPGQTEFRTTHVAPAATAIPDIAATASAVVICKPPAAMVSGPAALLVRSRTSKPLPDFVSDDHSGPIQPRPA
jgi:hypothetical protein